MPAQEQRATARVPVSLLRGRTHACPSEASSVESSEGQARLQLLGPRNDGPGRVPCGTDVKKRGGTSVPEKRHLCLCVDGTSGSKTNTSRVILAKWCLKLVPLDAEKVFALEAKFEN